MIYTNHIEKDRHYLDRLLRNSYIAIYIFCLFFSINLEYSYSLAPDLQDQSEWLMCLLPAFWSIGILVLLSAIKNPFRFKLATCFVLFIASILYLGEHMLWELNKSLFDGSTLVLLLASNSNEAKEFFQIYTNIELYTQSISALAVNLLILLIAKLLLRRLDNSLKSPSSRLISRGFCLLILTPMFLIGLTKFSSTYQTVAGDLGEIPPSRMTTMDRIILSILTNIKMQEKIEASMQFNSQNNEEQVCKPKLPPHKLILIIGETTRADFMNCYGYPLENTPQLNKLVRNDEVILFSDVVSSAVYTIEAVPNMLSTKANNDLGEWYDKPLLPIVLKEAGYTDRSYLNGQINSGLGGNFPPAIRQIMDRLVFTASGQQDGELLPLVQERASLYQEQQREKYVFDIVHLMGSHGQYKSRYPQSFARFDKSDLEHQTDLDNPRKEILAQYLNTIYYNDYIVSEILKANQDIPSIIIYLSDHGEALFDVSDRPQYAGHYLSLGGATIPMMIYLSSQMKSLAPSLWFKIREAKDKAFSSDLLAVSILGLLGIEAPCYKAEQDLFSKAYENPKFRYVYQGKAKPLKVRHSLVNPDKVLQAEAYTLGKKAPTDCRK